MKKICLSTLVIAISLASTTLLAQSNTLQHVEPPFWWAGMNNPELQIMLHGEGIGAYQATIEYPGVKLKQVTSLENPNYLVLDLELSEQVSPGTMDITLQGPRRSQSISHSYELKAREEGSATRESFTPADVLYLITPDRFANGNPDNDEVAGLKEGLNREFKGGRHGGDIQGINDHLDYIKDMGFTAIWVNPVLENDMQEYSYHGYSTTDFYKVDARFGSNDEYRASVKMCNDMGIKVIMDMIVNHAGSDHWWMTDLPTSDWVNYQDEYLQGEYQITTHRKSTIQDPYVSAIDLKEFTDGWFVTTMPDLNQRNPYVAKYLIQNSIWWIEYSGIAGIRMDTYPYPDKDFMTDWTCAVQAEYPDFNTVGEEWFNEPAIVAHWQQGKVNANGYTSCLPSLMDFPLQEKLVKGLNEEESGFSGWVTTYVTLGMDFLYADPMNLVVFPDNHDMSRFYTQVNEDFDLFKLGLAYTLTTRGIPQLYYGTEILMSNPGTTDHGVIRTDFPGGWEGDEVNAFTGQGLTADQKEAQAFTKKLLTWRKDQSAVHNGKMMHFSPRNGIYVLFRYDENDMVMVVLSKSAEEVDLDLSRFSEILPEGSRGVEVLTGESVILDNSLRVPAKKAMVIDLD